MEDLLRILADWEPEMDGRLIGVKATREGDVLTFDVKVDFPGRGEAHVTDIQVMAAFAREPDPARAFIHSDLNAGFARLRKGAEAG